MTYLHILPVRGVRTPLCCAMPAADKVPHTNVEEKGGERRRLVYLLGKQSLSCHKNDNKHNVKKH